MRYWAVEWVHDFPDEPVGIYAELDDNGYEQRKVEVFRDGRMDLAIGDRESGGTRLACEPWPSLAEIALDPEFRPREMTEAQFERLWRQATDRSGWAPL